MSVASAGGKLKLRASASRSKVAHPFQPIINKCDDIRGVIASLFVVTFYFGFWRASLETSKSEQAIPKIEHTRNLVDEKALPGLRGVVKVSHSTINDISLVNLDGFAPASQWEELSTVPVSSAPPARPAEASR